MGSCILKLDSIDHPLKADASVDRYDDSGNLALHFVVSPFVNAALEDVGECV
jgi:hypothetical protein